MRAFSFASLIIFIFLFLLILWGGLNNFTKIVSHDRSRTVRLIILIIYGVVFTAFIMLYIYPFQIQQHDVNYSIYSYFNNLLFILFIINIPTSVSFVLHSIFENRHKNIFPLMGIIISLGLGCCMIYGTLLGAKEIVKNSVELHFKDLPHAFNGYKIVQISDLHLGNIKNPDKLLKKVKCKIGDIEFDLILFTGDLVNNFAYELNGLENSLRAITAKGTCYSILGNHDYGYYKKWNSFEKKQENFNAIVTSHRNVGFRLLRNEYNIIKKHKDSIFLVGVENWGHPPFPQHANLNMALQGIPENAFTILMTHDPAHWENKVKGRADIKLTLSGHTHGLQWGVKFAGITFSPAYFACKYWAGKYKYGDSVLYVNTGIGTIGIPWRLDMPAEITVFTLKGGEID